MRADECSLSFCLCHYVIIPNYGPTSETTLAMTRSMSTVSKRLLDWLGVHFCHFWYLLIVGQLWFDTWEEECPIHCWWRVHWQNSPLSYFNITVITLSLTGDDCMSWIISNFFYQWNLSHRTLFLAFFSFSRYFFLNSYAHTLFSPTPAVYVAPDEVLCSTLNEV